MYYFKNKCVPLRRESYENKCLKGKGMNVNATAVANYFIDLATKNNVELRQFGLMKRVYITHGFCLALLDKSALDPRYDVVEAWKNGPVIPSVYHSFKHNQNNPITEKSIIMKVVGDKFEVETPELEDDKIKETADAVWKKYLNYTDFEMIRMLHEENTPWALCYRVGKNNPIPDLYTKTYYKLLAGV